MAPNYLAYLNNPWADRYWRIGGEEIIDPHGPIAAGIARGAVRADPTPEPWRVAVGQLVHAAQARDLAGKLPKGLQEQVVKSSTAAIADILDDWCGTPPRKWPWPWPGPPPWLWEIVSELSMVANSLPAGGLRDVILDVAAQAVQKGNAAR